MAEPEDSGDTSFRDLFERNPVPMFIYDQAGMRILEGNEAAARQYGHGRQAFVSMHLDDLLLPEDRWRLEREHRTPHTGGFARIGVKRHMRADGSPFFVEVERLDLVFRGVPASLITASDITEKIEAETRRVAQDKELALLTDALRRQKEHLAAAQKVSHIGSIDRDLVTGIAVWSDEARDLFGLPEGPTPDRESFFALFHAEDQARFRAHVDAGEHGVIPPPIECRIVRPDGAMRWVRNVSDTVWDAAGKPLRRIGTFQDVTELHAVQERQSDLERSLRVAIDAAEEARREVEAANMELEGRVEARTAELRHAQMSLVTKERLSALGQLTATVAHEMRNPLSAIRNTIFAVEETARQHGLSLERPLQRMQRSIARCEHIISDLLDFTRAREPKLAPVALDEWLAELLDEQTVPVGITVERRLAAPDLVVPMDGERFRRVLINLIDNAVQAIEGGETGERRITIATASLPQPEIAVCDSGPGIPPEILPRIFEPLFSTKSFGTGLGLPTVKQIVEQHGGAIAVQSTPGGTTVHIRLKEAAPAAREEAPAATTERAA